MLEISRGQRRLVSGEALKRLVLASAGGEGLENTVLLALQGYEAFRECQVNAVLLVPRETQASKGLLVPPAFQEKEASKGLLVLLVPPALQEKEAFKDLLVPPALQDVYKGRINTTCWEFQENTDRLALQILQGLQDSQEYQACRECQGNPVLLVLRDLQDFLDLLVCLDRKVSREIAVT